MYRSGDIQWVSIHVGSGPFDSEYQRYLTAYDNRGSIQLEDGDHSASKRDRMFFSLDFRSSPMLRLEISATYMEMILTMILNPSERPGPLAFINGHPTFNEDGVREQDGETLDLSFS